MIMQIATCSRREIPQTYESGSEGASEKIKTKEERFKAEWAEWGKDRKQRLNVW